MRQEIIVKENFIGKRLDKFLSEVLNSVSRSKILKCIKEKKVLVDGEFKKPSYKVDLNQRVVVDVEEEKTYLKPYEFDIPIIYEDNHILVIDKPQNLVVQPDSSNKSIINALIYLKKELSTINPQRPGVVHRLDKETSGVMVFAKNNFSHLNLIEQFRLRKVKKEYLAISWGNIKQDNIKVDLPIGRDTKERVKMKISFIKSKQALSEIKVLERLNGAVLLLIRPITGRTHQIRVHLKFLELPIVGDKKYGIKDKEKELFLHASRLGFFHPETKKFLEFSSPMPLRFKNFIERYKNV